MHDFKRKTAKMPDFSPSPIAVQLAGELDEVGDLQCRTLALILKQSDSLEHKTTWACNEIMELSHVQSQLINANNNHAEKIDAIERRELTFNAKVAAYRDSVKASVTVLVLLGGLLSGVVSFGVNYFFNQQKEPHAEPRNPVELARPTN